MTHATPPEGRQPSAGDGSAAGQGEIHRPDRRSPAAASDQHRPSGAINPAPVQYKGAPLDPGRGPGLGCFRFQLVVLAVLIVATPLSVGRVPDVVSGVLLFATIGLLLVTGQTIIFLLRLVAAERRGRRQPLASRTPTVGQLEDAAEPGESNRPIEDRPPDDRPPTDRPPDDGPPSDRPPSGPDAGASPAGPVRQ